MKNQVTSIEQSKRLIELGVPAEKVSMVWFPVAEYTGKGFEMMLTGEYDLYCKDRTAIQYADCIFYAFTVADLLAVLPKKIMTNGGKVHILHIEACSSTSPCWCLYWGDEATQVGWQERISFLHLLEDAIEWLCLNGYKLNL